MESGKDMLFPDWDLDTIIKNLNPTGDDEVSQVVDLIHEEHFDEAYQWLRVETSRYPWVMLAAAHLSLRQGQMDEARRWLRAVTLIATDTTVQLWAWHNLRKLGREPSAELAKKVMGIILEVPNQQGEDVLASYADGTARFLSYAGGMILWEDYDERITPLIHEGMRLARPIGDLVEEHRTAIIPEGEVRLSVLTPGGMHVWQGSPEEGSDIARLFARQAVLLKTLIQLALENRNDQ